MMNRRRFLGTVSASLFAAALAVDAQQARKVPRIGVLMPFSTKAGAGAQFLEAFRQGLSELGYVEGQTIQVEARWEEEKAERFPALATELVQLNTDVIVAVSPTPIRAAKNSTSTIPIVMVTLADPVALGFVTSLAKPGGNVTGLTGLAPELAGKRLDLLTQVARTPSRVAVLTNPAQPSNLLVLRETSMAARALRVELQILEVRDPRELESAFSAVTKKRADAIVVLPDPMFFTERRHIVALALRTRLPAMYSDNREWAEVGGLMSYGPNLADMHRRAAYFVDRILKGAKPADLPVEQPTKFELVINLKTAKALGLTIPPSLLGRADQVIE